MIYQLASQVSLGWGLRRRFSWIDALVRSWERDPRIHGRRLMVTMRCDDVYFKLYVSGDQPGPLPFPNSRMFLDGHWEPRISRLLVQAIRPGDAFLDVGAHIGYYSMLAGTVAGREGKVLAFEPNPSNFDLLKRNILLNKLEGVVVPINQAVADTDAPRRLFLNDRNVGGHTLFPHQLISSRCVEVHCTVLDKLLEHRYPELVDRITVVKLDVEGFEYYACKGMATFLARTHAAIFSEFWPYGLQCSGSSDVDYLRLFESLGYVLYRIPKPGARDRSVTESERQEDLLWLKPGPIMDRLTPSLADCAVRTSVEDLRRLLANRPCIK